MHLRNPQPHLQKVEMAPALRYRDAKVELSGVIRGVLVYIIVCYIPVYSLPFMVTPKLYML